MTGENTPLAGNWSPTCEPPVGATARDDRGHEWVHADDGWHGCMSCDPDDPQRWSWNLICADTYDTALTVHTP